MDILNFLSLRSSYVKFRTFLFKKELAYYASPTITLNPFVPMDLETAESSRSIFNRLNFLCRLARPVRADQTESYSGSDRLSRQTYAVPINSHL